MARPKRIVLYLLSAAGLGFLGMLALDTAMWIIPPERGWAFWRWDSTGPISVGDGFSIAFQTRTAHPMLAEYDQRVFIFGGTEREGRHLATLDLEMNTGGRTHVLVHTYSDAAGHRHIQLTDRYGTQDVDLVSLRLGKAPDSGPPRLFIGTFSGEAYPLKFIAPAQLSEESAAIKKQ